MECSKCGAELDFREAFCSKCGELTHRSRPLAEQLGKAAAELGTAGRDIGVELAKLGGTVWSYVRDEANRKQVIAGGAVLVLLGLVLTDNPISNLASDGFGSAPEGPQLTADGTPDLASYEDVYLGEEVRYQVTSTANVRDYPTSQGSQVTHTFSGGETVFAREVMAFDRTSRWFKLTSGGYIWGENLAPISAAMDATTPVFPANLRGNWSSMDRCRGGDFEYEITIAEDQIQFYESYGELTRISYDENQNAHYHLAMRGEGNSWNSTFAIMLTANGMSIVFEEVSEADPIQFAYHNPDAGCGRVFFLD